VNRDEVIVRACQTADQFEAKNLIEAGLKERFQPYVSEYNLDLDDLEPSLWCCLLPY
jgi:hypothetical protein